MAPDTQRPKLIAIVGPTASGKSDLSMRIAKKYNGEIICADSLTIYRDMDIGTAKPSESDQREVPHWGLDLVGPGQRFTASQFKDYAENTITDIQKRGRLPVVVGGTGLYIDSLLYDFQFGADADLGERQKLEKLSIEQLQQTIKTKNYPMPENSQNRRHLTRTIERKGKTGSRTSELPANVILIGILSDDEVLKDRINQRVKKMYDAGLVKETQKLLKKYGPQSLRAKAAVAYGSVIDYLLKATDLEQSKQLLATAHWQYARRQKTWFRRNKHIKWFKNSDNAYRYIDSNLK